MKNQKLTLNLLYKASADTDKAAAFHAKCDQAKSSIVLMKLIKGKDSEDILRVVGRGIASKNKTKVRLCLVWIK